MSGYLQIIGVGPGDPELITLKAARLIAEADVVTYPTTQSGKARARDIASKHISGAQHEIGFSVPMRVERAAGQDAYDKAANDISEHLNAGKTVALLCEGDPFFYGSAMYLYARLAERYRTDIIPAVTSLTACSAALRRPLAARNEVLTVLPAPLAETELEAGLKHAQSVAIIKVGRHFTKVRRVLARLGLTERAAIIQSATNSDQQVVQLNDFPGDEQPYFSTILVYRGDEAWGATGEETVS